MDELLNDPFVNGIDREVYVTNCEAVKSILEPNHLSNCLNRTMLQKLLCVVLATNMASETEKIALKKFKQLNKSKSGLISKDELIDLFMSVGYDYNLSCNISDDLLVNVGEQMIGKDCDCDSSISTQDCPHEIEGIPLFGFKMLYYNSVVTRNRTYLTRVFDIFDCNNDGFVDFDDLSEILDNVNDDTHEVDMEYDMHEMKRSQTTGTDPRDLRIRDVIREIDKTGDNKISLTAFVNAMLKSNE